MKNKLILLVLLGATIAATAQNPQLWSTTLYGGALGGGNIFQINGDGTSFANRYSFSAPYVAEYTMVLATNNTLYGITGGGGANGVGVIFTVDPVSNIYTEIFDFAIATGSNPNGHLIQAANGKLYGLANRGGAYNRGAIFSYDYTTGTYADLYDFNVQGNTPYGNLVQAANGMLYGMTYSGGNSNEGTIFSYDIASATFNSLYSFDGIGGASPYGSLMQASNGLLYGMTYQGGINDYGVIFSFDPVTSSYVDIYDFPDSTGSFPQGSLIQATDGNLYGMTSSGGVNSGGVLFRFNISSGVYADIWDMIGQPFGDVIQSSNGLLYGMSNYGGLNSQGNIFKYDIASGTYNDIYSFLNSDGSIPYASLTEVGAGMLYGMASMGGNNNYGVVFVCDILGIFQKLHDYPGNEGCFPDASITQADNGLFYGLTNAGGTNDAGIIYSFRPSDSDYHVVYNFDMTHGGSPVGSMIKATNGKLYGVVPYGGANGEGVLYSFDPSTNTYADLFDFIDTTGFLPWRDLLQATNGKLYGYARTGGLNNNGALFSFDITTQTYADVHDFSAAEGRISSGTPMQASNGLIYGLTRNGGANNVGIIFSFNTSNNVLAPVYDMDALTGNNCWGRLTEASNGFLYGVTELGGGNGYGTLFSFNTANSAYAVVHHFDFTQGGYPYRSMTRASNGILYGSADGGAGNGGVLYSYNTVSGIYVETYDFNGVNGNYANDLIEYDSTLNAVSDLSKENSIIISPNPVHGNGVITFYSASSEILSMTLSDITGRVLIAETITASSGKNKKEIITGELAKGVYVVTLSGAKRNVSEKIIKE